MKGHMAGLAGFGVERWIDLDMFIFGGHGFMEPIGSGFWVLLEMRL